ncbi:MAG: DUF2141 domain-containing protein [Cyclonatronaceae bacterium]
MPIQTRFPIPALAALVALLPFLLSACIAPLTAQAQINAGTVEPAMHAPGDDGTHPPLSLSVETGEFRRIRGDLYIEVSDAGGETLAAEIHPVTGRSLTVRFDSLTSGPKAVRLFHDENGNADLDTNFLGIPTEGYGFSNNPRSRFGAPSLEDQLFEHRADTTISISLVYW